MDTSSQLAADGLTLEALAIQVHDLAMRVRRLELASNIPPVVEVAQETLDHIRELTEKLFPGPVESSVEVDPENPTRQWILFTVTTRGEYRDYRDLEFRWYEAVAQITCGSETDFRLCVVPVR